MSVYNENRDNNMSLHDEIKEQNAKMKGQPFSVKFAYFKEYYLKMTIIIAACAVGIIALIISIITGPHDTAFGCYLINAGSSTDSEPLRQEFVSKAGIDTKKYEVFVDTSLYYNPDDSNPYSYVSFQKVTALVAAGDLDVIIGDKTAIDYYAYGGNFSDITTTLPEDLLEKFQDKIYYYTDTDGELIPVGIYIDDSTKLKEYGYYEQSPAIFCIIANSDSLEYDTAFLQFLYEE